MGKIIRIWNNEVHCQGIYAGEQAILPESPSGECELMDAELEAVRGAYGYGGAYSYSGAYNSGSAPVSPTCLQSILLGNGNCGTQSLSEANFAATSNTDLGRSR